MAENMERRSVMDHKDMQQEEVSIRTGIKAGDDSPYIGSGGGTGQTGSGGDGSKQMGSGG
jgi:hypothetical protein